MANFSRRNGIQSSAQLRCASALPLVLGVIFIGAAGSLGARILWTYQTTPGPQITAPREWARQSRIARSGAQPTLLLFTHPGCTCTRASFTELETIYAALRAADKRVPATYVLMVGAQSGANAANHSALVSAASELTGSRLVWDEDAREARLFRVRTSGQVLLYDTAGHLAFTGGVTSLRGHVGFNPGADALRISLQFPGTLVRFPVFGCSLFSDLPVVPTKTRGSA